MLVSFDMETAGEHVGVVQISAEILRVGLEPTGNSFTKDRKGTVSRGVTFNEYVNPNSDLDWDPRCIRSHHLLPTDPKIKDADEIDVVWGRFATWIEQNIAKDETGIVIAWNGTSCDLKWIWKLTQAPLSTLSMPVQIEFYIDPYRAIMQYDKNPLHPSQSSVESMELGVIWKYINGGANLNGAHDSLVDAKAQSDIVCHDHFVAILNRSKTVQSVNEIFAKKDMAEWKRQLEPTRPVHSPWTEQTADSNVEWSPGKGDNYQGDGGGPPAGPTSYIRGVAESARDLACIFIAIVPMLFFIRVARLTQKYAYEDWVVEKEAKDRDGKTKKRKVLDPCPATTNGRPTPGRRRRADKEKYKYKITPGFVLAWIGMLIVQGAHLDSNKRGSRNLW